MLFLPTIGDYDVYLAAGDQAGSQTINVQVLDAATAFITITNVLTGAADSYVDASGATRTRAQWIADSAFGGTKVTRTFAGTVLNINLNAPSADSSCIAHLFLAQRTTSAVCDTSAFPKPFMRTPQLAGRFI
jgi:hypothetical protein